MIYGCGNCFEILKSAVLIGDDKATNLPTLVTMLAMLPVKIK